MSTSTETRPVVGLMLGAEVPAYIKSERIKWAKVIKQSGAKAE
jgi:hypothetical protein